MSARRAALAALLVAGLASAAGAATKAELEAELAAVLQELQQANKEAAEKGTAGTPEHAHRMMDLISGMQRIQSQIANFSGSVLDEFADLSDAELEARILELRADYDRVSRDEDQTRAREVNAEYRRAWEAMQERNRQQSGGKLLDADGVERTYSQLDAQVFFDNGKVERGLNVVEAIIAGGVSRKRLANFLWAGNHYLDLLADAERCLDLATRVRDFCEQELADEKDPALRHDLIGYHRNARQAMSRALAPLGRRKELARHLERSEAELTKELAAVGTDEREDILFHVAGLFQLGTEVWHGGMAATDPETKASYGKRALEFIERAEGLLATASDQENWDVLNWVNTLRHRKGTLLQTLGRTEEALETWELYLETEALYEKKYKVARGGHYYALALIEYAASLEAAGRMDAAIRVAEQAYDRHFGTDRSKLAIGAYQSLSWKPSFLLGKLYRAKGDPAAALEHFGKAIEIIESLYAKLRSGKLKGSFLSFDECGAAYDHMVSIHLEKGDPAAALAVLDRSKSAVLLDMLRSQPLRERSRWPKLLLERERELKRRLRQLKRDVEPAPGDGTRSGTPESSESLQEVYQDYELFLRDVQESVQAPEDATGARKVDEVWSHDPETLKKAGTNGRVVVAYFDDGEQVRAFVVKDGEVRVYATGKSGKIARDATRLRRNVTSRSRRWERYGEGLYEDLIAPWEAALAGARELVVVPTGELFALPFGALPDGEGVPLANKVPLSFVSQLSLLAEATSDTRPKSGALVFADPDGSLPNARIEGAQVVEAAGEGASVLEGEAATEGALKARVGYLRDQAPPGTLHLATHGLLDKGAHLLSSLVLSPDDIEDGSLTFAEIFNDLDLRQTPVVVLSACNTAVGETRGGDEVAGLARAFQYAGAEWVVASLWEVSDKASAALMASLHEGLAAGLTVDEALRKAQLAIQQQDEDWKHPYFWAAFAAYRR